MVFWLCRESCRQTKGTWFGDSCGCGEDLEGSGRYSCVVKDIGTTRRLPPMPATLLPAPDNDTRTSGGLMIRVKASQTTVVVAMIVAAVVMMVMGVAFWRKRAKKKDDRVELARLVGGVEDEEGLHDES